ncbi:MAG TPA: sigma-70 family RNA polymerase sigma factor, partial [Opitutaceae bacterium]|nr:sigma-70 family RNA polymerase sigma factor [Opitutaceae bacterium]
MSDDPAGRRQDDGPDPERDFPAWVQRHFDLVYSAALRQLGGDSHAARDVAQLVFLAAARKRQALARHPAAVGWLYTATHYAVSRMIREESNRRRRERTAAELEEAGRTETDWTAVRPHLDAALVALGSREREALLLRFFEQHSFAEVGARLSLSENAARMRVDRALDKLRRSLARRGVVSS